MPFASLILLPSTCSGDAVEVAAMDPKLPMVAVAVPAEETVEMKNRLINMKVTAISASDLVLFSFLPPYGLQ